MTRGEEQAFKRGYDKGRADQKKADPPPKAKQYRDELDALALEVRELLSEYARDGKLSIVRITAISTAATVQR